MFNYPVSLIRPWTPCQGHLPENILPSDTCPRHTFPRAACLGHFGLRPCHWAQPLVGPNRAWSRGFMAPCGARAHWAHAVVGSCWARAYWAHPCVGHHWALNKSCDVLGGASPHQTSRENVKGALPPQTTPAPWVGISPRGL